ncbi:MAG: hypothetical protein ACI9UN_004048 [Granulosicoccus sp.]|jgi:hypothetical protein
MTEVPIARIDKALLNRPDNILDGVGALSWQAYNAMETTKRRHYELLEIIDNKKKNYNIDPTAADQHLLRALLRDHDEQVKRFTSASMALKDADAAAHTALFVYIGGVNSLAEASPTTH